MGITKMFLLSTPPTNRSFCTHQCHWFRFINFLVLQKNGDFRPRRGLPDAPHSPSPHSLPSWPYTPIVRPPISPTPSFPQQRSKIQHTASQRTRNSHHSFPSLSPHALRQLSSCAHHGLVAGCTGWWCYRYGSLTHLSREYEEDLPQSALQWKRRIFTLLPSLDSGSVLVCPPLVLPRIPKSRHSKLWAGLVTFALCWSG